MRISGLGHPAPIDSELRAAHGHKEPSHAAGAHEGHPKSPVASSPPANGASGPDSNSNSHDAAMRQAFNTVLGAIAFQMVDSQMASLSDAMTETEEDT
ncbi:hypothetical protein [Bradyrhizobium sp. UFLA05-112]